MPKYLSGSRWLAVSEMDVASTVSQHLSCV